MASIIREDGISQKLLDKFRSQDINFLSILSFL